MSGGGGVLQGVRQSTEQQSHMIVLDTVGMIISHHWHRDRVKAPVIVIASHTGVSNAR